MTRASYLAALILCAATPVAAQDIQLIPPIDCVLGTECYIQQYVDHDPGKGARDYQCAPLSYNRHKGTDFALRTMQQMDAGVNVLASAPGTVVRLRASMPDRLKTAANAEKVAGRECGNSVVIDHGQGWETQYCHLKQNSLKVRKGDVVAAGDVLGQVGLSGSTQFPHVHLSVRQDSRMIDPFDPDGVLTCGAPDKNTLWADTPDYQPGGMIYTAFHDAVPEYADVKSGRAALPELPLDADALVVFGYAFGLQKGDSLRLIINGPKGEVIDHTATLEKNKAQFFQAAGKRLTGAAWPAGVYRGSVSLIRKGRVISTQSGKVTLR